MSNLIEKISINLDINNDKDIKTLNYMLDNKKYPSLINLIPNNISIIRQTDGIKYINNLLENFQLKRACCMRKNKTDDENVINIKQLIKFNEKYYFINKKYKFTNLNKKCSNISNSSYLPQTDKCTNFFTVYCKILQALNQNIKQNKYKYYSNIKYGDTDSKGKGDECSCINNPLLYDTEITVKQKNKLTGGFKDIKINNSNIIKFSEKCADEKNVYMSKNHKDILNKPTNITYTICNANNNLNDITSNNINMRVNVKQYCGNNYDTSTNKELNNTKPIEESTNTKPIEESTNTKPIEESNNTKPIEESNNTKLKKDSIIKNLNNKYFIIGIILSLIVYLYVINKN